MALLSSGFVIDDPSEISNTMQQILRGELGLDRTGDFEELEIDIDEEDDDDDWGAVPAFLRRSKLK